MALGLTAGSIGFRNFGAERVNWMREHETGLSTGAYVIGKSLCEIPIIVLYVRYFALFLHGDLYSQISYLPFAQSGTHSLSA